jgi:hypothetical protein
MGAYSFVVLVRNKLPRLSSTTAATGEYRRAAEAAATAAAERQ